MTGADRTVLTAYVTWAARKDQGAWVLLHWMGTHGTGCTLRYVLRIPAWVCEWIPDDVSRFGEGAEPEAAVLACARRALAENGHE